MIRAAVVSISLAAALVACVPPLPGGSLAEPSDGSADRAMSAGAGGAWSAPVMTGGGAASGTGAVTGPGTGGAPGPGGPGSGGAAGIAGPPGTGGGGGLGCSDTPMAVETVTNFNDLAGSDPITFGPPGITGQIFAFATDTNGPTVSVTAGPNGTNALWVTSPPGSGSAFGAGLRFDPALDVNGYNAVRFTYTSLGCAISFAPITAKNASSSLDPRGMCTQAPCPLPLTGVPGDGTVCLPLVGDASPLLGLLWDDAQGSFRPCAFIIDDVVLVRQ